MSERAHTKGRWTPILSRDGQFYCSPACGGGTFCRRSWFDHATKAADDLAARMGDGWRPVVWENLGWHYRVEKGVAAIHPNEDRTQAAEGGAYPVKSFTAYLNTAKQFVVQAETPEDALGFATQDARAHVSRVTDALNDLFEASPSGDPSHG